MSRARAVNFSWTSVAAPAGQVTAARGAQSSKASRRERILIFQQTGAPFCWMQALDAGVIQGCQQGIRLDAEILPAGRFRREVDEGLTKGLPLPLVVAEQ